MSARGIKAGDHVKILRGAKTREGTWENSWEPSMMDKYIGTIQRVEGVRGADVFFEDVPYGFPYFVLEVVHP